MSTKVVNPVELPAALIDFIGKWKEKRGNLIMVLHKVQQHYGYVPRKAAMEVARMLDVPLAKIYGVVTFYHFFKLKKPGKYNIQVCMGTACYLKGGEDIIDELEELLGIGVNSVTEDGLFSIEAVRCVGCCGLAPVLVIGTDVYGKLKKDDIAGVIAKYEKLERGDSDA
jgi:NADH-quinone oxidoreductase subunit E